MANSFSVSKKDVIWSYFSQFFSMASGILILPFILHLLSTEEIAMNYIMMSISSLVVLFDFGFSPQFARNITYIFNGVQELKKEGIHYEKSSKGQENVNYKLLAIMIQTTKFVYKRLALLAISFMLTIGTLYIYHITDGFKSINNILLIWFIYSISTFFNIYYSYYDCLLLGKGMIKESKQAIMYSRITNLILSFTFLFFNMGLMGLALANLIAPFVNRLTAHYYFFTRDLSSKIRLNVSKEDKLEVFLVIWYNAKKLGLVVVGAYAISKFGIFLAGLFLPANMVASYGLMLQLVGVISAISTTLVNTYNPTFASLRIIGDKNKLLKVFSFTMNIYYLLFILGVIFLLFIVPFLLKIINSNVMLPSIGILIIYSIVALLEGNHSNFATLILSENKIPFLIPSLISGGLIIIGSYIVLYFTSLGILGLVLVQGIVQLSYSNWKWPYVVCKDFEISFLSFLVLSTKETYKKINLLK